MVEDGNVTIVAVQNEFQETGTGRVTFELYPQNGLDNVSLPEEDGNYMVTAPTRINGTEYWDEALADAGGIYQGVDDTGDGEPDLLNLSVEPDALELSSVGIGLEPDEEPTKSEEQEAADNIQVPEEADGIQAAGASQAAGRFEFKLKNNGNEPVDIVGLGIISTNSSEAVEVNSNIPGTNSAPLILTDPDVELVSEDIIEFNSSNDDANMYDFIDSEEVKIEPDEETNFFEFDAFGDGGNSGNSKVSMKDKKINISVRVEDTNGDVSETALVLVDD